MEGHFRMMKGSIYQEDVKRNESGDKTQKNIWDAVNTLLRDKFVGVKSCIFFKKEKCQIDNLIFHFKIMEKNSKLNHKQAEKEDNKDYR